MIEKINRLPALRFSFWRYQWTSIIHLCKSFESRQLTVRSSHTQRWGIISRLNITFPFPSSFAQFLFPVVIPSRRFLGFSDESDFWKAKPTILPGSCGDVTAIECWVRGRVRMWLMGQRSSSFCSWPFSPPSERFMCDLPFSVSAFLSSLSLPLLSPFSTYHSSWLLVTCWP